MTYHLMFKNKYTLSFKSVIQIIKYKGIRNEVRLPGKIIKMKEGKKKRG